MPGLLFVISLHAIYAHLSETMEFTQKTEAFTAPKVSHVLDTGERTLDSIELG